MTKITCTRRLEFDAAHRVMGHEGKCINLHGHRYTVEATFQADALDDLGRTIDFSVIKERLGNWIDSNWDHNTILWDKDQVLGGAASGVTTQKIYYMPYNPTAENMAKYLIEDIIPKLIPECNCVQVTLRETPNGFADAIV